MQSAKERLRSLEDNVNNLMFRMDDLKAQEDALSNQNQSVASHLMAVSSLTSVLVLAVGVLQFDAVKHVLRKRHFIR